MLNKIIFPGSVTIGKTAAPIFCRISIDEKDRLSISGVIGPLASGNARGSCGQIDMGFKHRNPQDDDPRTFSPIPPEEIEFSRDWNAEKWFNFLEVWHRWHLNDMRAGCEHQRALGWEREGYEKHPSERCPQCGYKFGTAWLSEPLPLSVIAFLHQLPDSKRSPAWV